MKVVTLIENTLTTVGTVVDDTGKRWVAMIVAGETIIFTPEYAALLVANIQTAARFVEENPS